MDKDWNSLSTGKAIPLFCLNIHKVVYMLYLDHVLSSPEKCCLQRVLYLNEHFQLDCLHWLKSRSRRIKPCGTPALMIYQHENWAFRKTCCFLLCNCNKLPQTPLRCNLQISYSGHTLSNPLYISGKTRLTFNPS